MMDLSQLLGGASLPKPGEDVPTMDTAETVHISSLALLKVGRRGGPFSLPCGRC